MPCDGHKTSQSTKVQFVFYFISVEVMSLVCVFLLDTVFIEATKYCFNVDIVRRKFYKTIETNWTFLVTVNPFLIPTRSVAKLLCIEFKFHRVA